jgi:molybdopterin synthase catalytic subunit
MPRVRVLFFALLRERVKCSEAEWTLAPGATVADLWDAVAAAHPQVGPLAGSVSFAVNQEYADRGQVLADGDEVALIPPVSGG